eukprot:1663435-Amphidinium_carterae.1
MALLFRIACGLTGAMLRSVYARTLCARMQRCLSCCVRLNMEHARCQLGASQTTDFVKQHVAAV